MGDPRKAIGYGDVLYVAKTYKADNTITYDATKEGGSDQVGKAVTFFGRAADTVGLVGADEGVHGRLELVEPDGFCTVAISGELTFPGGESATLTVGSKIVGALGVSSAEGYIKTVGAPTTTAATLAQLNALNASRGTIRNSSDATKVIVELRAP